MRFLTVNNSWRLAPWADALYASDLAWWRANNGAPEFAGLKVARNPCAAYEFAGVHYVRMLRDQDGSWPDTMVLDEPYTIGAGGNSGFQAINLAVLFGARKIILVGFDMRVDRGSHWHGDHTGGLGNPDSEKIERWRSNLDNAAESLSAAGVTVINASAVSALRNYPKMSFREALSYATPGSCYAA